MVSYIPSPPQPAPIGAGTYTSWPGGVDPTVRLYNTDDTVIKGGRRRRSTRRRRNVMRKKSRRMHRK
jgi:hypothetical protein